MLRFVAAAAAAAAIGVAAVSWRLSQGPVSLAILTPYLEDAIRFSDADLRVALDDTVLTWAGWQRTLDIRAVNVRLGTVDGPTVAVLPQMSIGLSMRALAFGKLVPNSVDLIGLKLRIVRRADGSLDYGVGGADEDDSNEQAVAIFLRELAQESKAGSRLNRLSILDAEVVFDDQQMLASLAAEGADLVLWRDVGGIRGNLDFAVQLGQRLARLSVSGRYDRISRATGLSLGFADLEPAQLAGHGGVLTKLAGIRLPVSGRIDMAVDDAWRLQRIGFDATAEAGVVELPELFGQSIALDDWQGRGTLDPSFQSVTFDSFRFRAGTMTADLAGALAFGEAGLGVKLKGSVNDLAGQEISRYWPIGLAKEARRWVDRNLRGGTVNRLEVDLDLTPEMIAQNAYPPDALLLEFDFEDVASTYLGDMTPLTGASGKGRLDLRRFDLEAGQAMAGELRLSDAKLTIDNILKRGPVADIGFVVTGRAADQLALIDMKPLLLTRKMGLVPDKVGGLAATRVRLKVPLKAGLTTDMVGVVAAANIRDGALADILDRWDLSEGKLTLRADGKGLDLEGEASLNGVPMKLQWVQEFRPKGPYGSRYELAGRIDDADRRALNLPLDPWLRGPVDMTLKLDAGPKGQAAGKVALDLADATLDVAPALWRKAPQTPAKMTFDIAIDPDGAIRLSRIDYRGDGVRAAGEADLAPGGGLERLTLRRADFGENRLAVTWVAQRNGTFTTVSGETIDLRPWVDVLFSKRSDSASSGGAGPATGPIDTVVVNAERAILNGGVSVRDFALRLKQVGDLTIYADADGAFADGQAVNLLLQASGAGRKLRLTSEDAGRLARALDLHDSIVGGDFRLIGTYADDQPGAPFTGEIRMRKLKLTKAPLLAKILSLGSLTGIGDLLGGEGIRFTEATVRLRTADGIMEIKKGAAHGPALGITTRGAIDLRSETLKLRGNIIPAYTLNSVLGYIPLLGKLLVPDGEGIFGMTYTLTGPVDDPNPGVNPLSALAPGILRCMFFCPGLVDEDPYPELSDPWASR